MSEQWPSKEQEIWFQAGVTGEKQRIIKLLEEQKKTYSSPIYSTTGGFVENFALDQAIELIKGETK